MESSPQPDKVQGEVEADTTQTSTQPQPQPNPWKVKNADNNSQPVFSLTDVMQEEQEKKMTNENYSPTPQRIELRDGMTDVEIAAYFTQQEEIERLNNFGKK
eukprot:Pgem_evm1s6732